MPNRLTAKFIETAYLVFDGWRSGTLSATFINIGIGLIDVSFVL